MSTLSSANVTDINFVLKECAHKIKIKYSMHQYSNFHAQFRQLANRPSHNSTAIICTIKQFSQIAVTDTAQSVH